MSIYAILGILGIIIGIVPIISGILKNKKQRTSTNNAKIEYRAIGSVRFDKEYSDGEVIPPNVIDPSRISDLIKLGRIERINK